MSRSTASNPRTTGHAQISFLDLPAEIRNQIYDYALRDVRSRFLNDLRRPALAATCRQVQQEALPIFFFVNQFEFHLSRPFPGQDCNLLLRPWTCEFLKNTQLYLSHMVAINVYSTIRYKLWNGFFSLWKIRVRRSGNVQVELDVSKLIGRTRSICYPIMLALDERLNFTKQPRHSRGLGLADLESIVDIFRPHVLNGEGIRLGRCAEAQLSTGTLRSLPQNAVFL